MAHGAGKRAGARRAAKRRPKLRAATLSLGLAVILCVAAWGYLVWAAIEFGSTARGGDDASWIYLGTASVGAIACLFTGLMLIARLLRSLGLIDRPVPDHSTDFSGDTTTDLPAIPPQGGRRRAS